MTSSDVAPENAATRSMLLTALYVAQEQYGSLTPAAIERVAERLHLTPKEVYETATFYSMFRTEPHGQHVIQVCEGLSCFLAGGAERLVDHLCRVLGVEVGGTSRDGLFTLQTVQCLAACDVSPAMRVDDTLYTHLTPQGVDTILAELMAGG